MKASDKIVLSLVVFGFSLAAAILGLWLVSTLGAGLAWHVQTLLWIVFVCQFVAASTCIASLFKKQKESV